MRVALLFGSFDPLHYGHLAIAGYALGWGGVERVWLVVSPQNPRKQDRLMAPAAQRCAEVEQALRAVGDERIALSRVELAMPRPSYTIATLERLREEYPQHDFALLVGGDSLASLPSWREGERIMAEYDILVYPRWDGTPIADSLRGHPRVRMLCAPIVQISSTFIREGWAAGRCMHCFTPVRRGGATAPTDSVRL